MVRGVVTRPDGGALVRVGLVAGVALLLDAVTVITALATVLLHSCGNDWAWMGMLGGAVVVSIAAIVGIVDLLFWWRTGRPPPGHVWLMRLIVVAAAASIALAVIAAGLFPDGSCPDSNRL